MTNYVIFCIVNLNILTEIRISNKLHMYSVKNYTRKWVKQEEVELDTHSLTG